MNISKKMTLVLACLLMTVAFSMVASAYYDDYYDSTAAAGFLGLSLVMCIVPIIWFIIAILIAIWVYKDANKRGSSGALWLIIVILTGIVGLIIWLVIRPPIGGEKKAADSDRRCPNCGRGIPMDARTCPYCGKNFEQG